jgi:hypothetical protein
MRLPDFLEAKYWLCLITVSRLRALADASRGDLRFAFRLATHGCLTPISRSAQPIDQPDFVLGRALKTHKSRSHRGNQRGQQDRRGDDGRTDQDRQRGPPISRDDRPRSLIIVSFWLKRGQGKALTFLELRDPINASGQIFVRVAAARIETRDMASSFESSSCASDGTSRSTRYIDNVTA